MLVHLLLPKAAEAQLSLGQITLEILLVIRLDRMFGRLTFDDYGQDLVSSFIKSLF